MIRPIAALALFVTTLLVTTLPTWAAQSLIPTPYPGSVGAGMPLNPEPAEPRRSQELMRDPYPRAAGASSQGNPPIMRDHRRQHLVPSIDQRKYRVDRH